MGRPETHPGAAAVPVPGLVTAGASQGSGIRACRASDMAAVARLIHREFRGRRLAVPDTLAPYLERAFLRHPWADPEITSLVYADAGGDVRGFIGVFPVRMSLDGEPVRAAVCGSLVVEKPAEHPLAGAKLLRTFLNGPQDLSFSESANAVSARMWDRLGHHPVAAYSLDWLRVLRPVGAAVAALGESGRGARLLAAPAALADSIVRRLGFGPFDTAIAGRGAAVGVDVDEDQIVAHILEFSRQFGLRPDWDESTLKWLLANASRKQRYGQAFRRVVHARSGEPVGCYVYYGRKRGIARVLNILARPDAMAIVVDDLLAHAAARGCTGVRGRAVPGLTDIVMRRKALFFCRSSLVMRAKDAAVSEAVRSGNALITGLAAEAWSRLIGDEFT